jgi:hypothetical protein
MNEKEWASVSGWIGACFRGGLDLKQEAAYARYLSHFEKAEVISAIDNLVLDGAIFMPLPGEIIVAMQPATPTFTEMWAAIEPVLRHASDHGERGCIALIREQSGDLIAGWVTTYGAIRLSREPIYDMEIGGIVTNRLNVSWKDATGSHQQRELTANKANRLLGHAEVHQLPRAA